MGLFDQIKRIFSGSNENSESERVSLEEQLAELEKCGVRLNEGISIDDLLYSFDREEYEENPYNTILYVVGFEVEREPWGRYFSDNAWDFDVECIEDNGDYERIVRNFARITGSTNRITDLEDSVDHEDAIWLKYKIDGQERKFDIPIDNDWADADTVSEIMEDVEIDGKDFYAVDNGQATVWFYLDNSSAKRLMKLSKGLLREPG